MDADRAAVDDAADTAGGSRLDDGAHRVGVHGAVLFLS
jgi:hypothetical protein